MPFIAWLAIAAALVLGGCASRPLELPPRAAPRYALPAASEGTFASIEAAISAKHGPEVSGFELIDSNAAALRWRLALIDSAQSSLDIQYYVWFGDTVGRLMMKRVLDAADRGVKVRVLIDDLNSLLRDAATVELRDEVFAMIDSHPNIEMRLFNPWKDRDLLGRAGDMVVDMDRLNQRMHNKSIIADNRAAIIGGRNLGDEYFGLNEAFNFHDLDVLCFGPAARQASAVFDTFWNSRWVLRVTDLKLAVRPADAAAVRDRLARELAQNRALAEFPIAPQSWTAELAAVSGRLHFGTSRVVSDIPTDTGIRQDMVEELYQLGSGAKRELLIVNAYIIPDDRFVGGLRTLKDQGVQIRILTNSLASHDVPAVNSHYKQWRRPLRESVADLHEMRHDAAIQSLVVDTPPTRAEFMGLHSKGMVVDRQRVFIGSMNFDPRSASINSEMGVLVDSPGLAEALARAIERDMALQNSWRVDVDASGAMTWTNDRETVTRQPARNWWQRVEDVFFMAFPRQLY
jgi:putative cardiolipin synthase